MVNENIFYCFMDTTISKSCRPQSMRLVSFATHDCRAVIASSNLRMPFCRFCYELLAHQFADSQRFSSVFMIYTMKRFVVAISKTLLPESIKLLLCRWLMESSIAQPPPKLPFRLSFVDGTYQASFDKYHSIQTTAASHYDF
jgi:hypothetical protein